MSTHQNPSGSSIFHCKGSRMMTHGHSSLFLELNVAGVYETEPDPMKGVAFLLEQLTLVPFVSETTKNQLWLNVFCISCEFIVERNKNFGLMNFVEKEVIKFLKKVRIAPKTIQNVEMFLTSLLHSEDETNFLLLLQATQGRNSSTSYYMKLVLKPGTAEKLKTLSPIGSSDNNLPEGYNDGGESIPEQREMGSVMQFLDYSDASNKNSSTSPKVSAVQDFRRYPVIVALPDDIPPSQSANPELNSAIGPSIQNPFIVTGDPSFQNDISPTVGGSDSGAPKQVHTAIMSIPGRKPIVMQSDDNVRRDLKGEFHRIMEDMKEMESCHKSADESHAEASKLSDESSQSGKKKTSSPHSSPKSPLSPRVILKCPLGHSVPARARAAANMVLINSSKSITKHTLTVDKSATFSKAFSSSTISSPSSVIPKLQNFNLKASLGLGSPKPKLHKKRINLSDISAPVPGSFEHCLVGIGPIASKPLPNSPLINFHSLGLSSPKQSITNMSPESDSSKSSPSLYKKWLSGTKSSQEKEKQPNKLEMQKSPVPPEQFQDEFGEINCSYQEIKQKAEAQNQTPITPHATPGTEPGSSIRIRSVARPFTISSLPSRSRFRPLSKMNKLSKAAIQMPPTPTATPQPKNTDTQHQKSGTNPQYSDIQSQATDIQPQTTNEVSTNAHDNQPSVNNNEIPSEPPRYENGELLLPPFYTIPPLPAGVDHPIEAYINRMEILAAPVLLTYLLARRDECPNWAGLYYITLERFYGFETQFFANRKVRDMIVSGKLDQTRATVEENDSEVKTAFKIMKIMKRVRNVTREGLPFPHDKPQEGPGL